MIKKMTRAQFRQLLATVLTMLTLLYAFCVTFLTIPTANEDASKYILGFLFATALAAVVAFYFGDSEKEEEPKGEAGSK